MEKIYVSELNEKDYNKVKKALEKALSEIGAIDSLQDALDSKLCDLNDTIDIEKVLNS